MLPEKTIFSILCLIFSAWRLLPAAVPINFIPQPREIDILEGRFHFKSGEILLELSDKNDPQLQFASQNLIDELFTHLNVKIAGEFKKTIHPIIFAYPYADHPAKNTLDKHDLQVTPEIGPEGYVLLVLPSQIILSANTPTGLFYAVQTLKQLIRSQRNPSIPCLKIKDWPRFPIRGILDDISRGPIPTMDFFKQVIRRCAELKLNAITYYTENVVRTRKHPLFSPPDALTLDEIKELVEFASRYHIDIIGCFQSFGHFEKILEYPQYEHLGEMGSLLSPAMPESYELLADVYSELAPLYPSPYFMVLGDELWALGKGASETMVRERGIADVYSDHINWIRDELAKYDKRILVAADEPLKHPQAFSLLKKDIILFPWDYSAKSSFDDILQPIHQHGFDTIIMPGISCWRRFYPNYPVSRVNIRNFIRDGAYHDSKGVITATWDDWGINFFSNNWYGIAYAADQSWSPENGQTLYFDQRFPAACHGDTLGNLTRIFKTLDSLSSFSAMQDMEATVFWSTLIPEYGIKSHIALDQWEDIRHLATLSKQLIDSTQTRHYNGDREYLRFVCNQMIYMADFRFSLIEMSSAYRSACFLQENPAECREKLHNIIDELDTLKQKWNTLSLQYRHLWRLENREHSLDRVMEKFKKEQTDLLDVEHRLGKALHDYERNHPLPPPVRVRLDIRELRHDFFQTWLLCGSFPNPKKSPDLPSHAPGGCVGFDTDYLLSIGGETESAPRQGTIVKKPDGTDVVWNLHTTPLGATIDLKAQFDPSERVVAYAYCTIYSKANTQATAALGSNDGIKVFLNGVEIFKKHELRFVKVDEDTVTLNLQKGTNRLLLKIDQGRGNWGFVFRILDHTFENRGYDYILLY